MVRPITICERARRKDSRDIKEEYGYILRWSHPTLEKGESKLDWIYLEEVGCSNEMKCIDIVDYDGNILNQEAYDFIKLKTYNGFRDKSSMCCYRNYVELFKIMEISKKEKAIEHMKNEIEDELIF